LISARNNQLVTRGLVALAATESSQEQLGQGVAEVEKGNEEVEVFHASSFLMRASTLEGIFPK